MGKGNLAGLCGAPCRLCSQVVLVFGLVTAAKLSQELGNGAWSNQAEQCVCPVLLQWDVDTASKAGKVQQSHISPCALLPQRNGRKWG